jgi:hypothetical protein
MKKIAILFALASAMSCKNPIEKPNTDGIANANQALDYATKMKELKKFMEPSDMHKLLASIVGMWDTKETNWMDEKTPPQQSTGTSEYKMILGGRYLQYTHKTILMRIPFEGMGIMGYDNNKKVFVSNWQDNWGTSMLYFEGSMDNATKTITLKGQYDDPAYGKAELRQEIKMIDDNHMEEEMYITLQGGKESKYFDMKLTKQ